jgi:hypothetical protein
VRRLGGQASADRRGRRWRRCAARWCVICLLSTRDEAARVHLAHPAASAPSSTAVRLAAPTATR